MYKKSLATYHQILRKYTVRADLGPKASFYNGAMVDLLWAQNRITRNQQAAFDRYKYLRHQSLRALGVKAGLSCSQLDRGGILRETDEEAVLLWQSLQRCNDFSKIKRDLEALYTQRSYDICKSYSLRQISETLDVLLRCLEAVGDSRF